MYSYVLLIRIASLFNKKAKKWFAGRKNWHRLLSEWRRDNPGQVCWMHCASLGEFEQGRTVLEALRNRHPEKRIVLTFFSPSGYEVRKNFSGADLVMYLPADTPAQSELFIKTLAPQQAYFVKYEYWANYFFACQRGGVPLYIIAAVLRPNQRFFGISASFWKRVLKCVHWFFVQDERTLVLLNHHGFQNASLTGDTRFDRVAQIKKSAIDDPFARRFSESGWCLVAGSTWPADESLIAQWMDACRSAGIGVRLIWVPHEIDHADPSIFSRTGKVVRWSEREQVNPDEADVLFVDRIGYLSSLYRYGKAAYIGGGFGKGIHNTLEAAVWGVPVLFGPRYQKFLEAKSLVACGGGFEVKGLAGLKAILALCMGEVTPEAGTRAAQFVEENIGATDLIIKHLTQRQRD